MGSSRYGPAENEPWRWSGGFDGDLVAQSLQTLDRAADDVRPISLVQVRLAQVLVRGAVAHDVIGDHQQCVRECHTCPLCAAPSGNATEVCSQIGVARV